jgi:hypothetical protein
VFDIPPHELEPALLTGWAWVSLVSGLVLVLLGARAAGLALLGAVVGAFVGIAIVSDRIEDVPVGAVGGATVGALVAGVAGLAWVSNLSLGARFRLGLVASTVAAVAVTSILVLSSATCGPQARQCLPTWGPGTRYLFAVDAAWIAVLVFAQPTRSATHAGPLRPTRA